MLKISNMTLYIKDMPLLNIPQLEVNAGDPLTIMGPSGCGKSTLLTAICGLLPPRSHSKNTQPNYRGEIWLNGKNITKVPTHKRRIGMLFQEDRLFPHLNVEENILFAIPSGKLRQRKQYCHQVLESIDLMDTANKLPHQLSGGQKARISLLRTLVSEPAVLLLDEPFSSLDVPLREAFRHLVFTRSQAIPTLLVTHDPHDAPGQIITLT